MNKIWYFSLMLNFFGILIGVFAVKKLGGLQWIQFLIENRGQGIAANKKHSKEIFDMLPVQDKTIIMLGNSITAGFAWHEHFKNPTILNRGIAGDNTADILQRLGAITKYQPQKIFLLIGVNDLLYNTPQYVAENYRKIVTTIRAQSPQTELFLESILPVNNQIRNTGISNQKILQTNQAIQQIAKDFNLQYIDIHSSMKNEHGDLDASLSLDGVHLNAKGYLVFADIIKNFL